MTKAILTRKEIDALKALPSNLKRARKVINRVEIKLKHA